MNKLQTKYFSMFNKIDDEIKFGVFKSFIDYIKKDCNINDMGQNLISFFQDDITNKDFKNVYQIFENCKQTNNIKSNFHLTHKSYNKLNNASVQNSIISGFGQSNSKKSRNYRTALYVIECSGKKYIEKFIHSSQKNLYLKVSKLYIEYIIQSYLSFIYPIPIPYMYYFIYEYNSESREFYLKTRSEYEDTTTLNKFFKHADFKEMTIFKKDILILNILLQISDYLNLYKIRCNFIHGDLLLNNIMIFYEKLGDDIILKQIKLIDFGSSSINIYIESQNYLLCDFSKKSGIDFLDTIENHDFAFSTDLTFLLLQIIYYKDYLNYMFSLEQKGEYTEDNIISNELQTKLSEVFNINFNLKNFDSLIVELKDIIYPSEKKIEINKTKKNISKLINETKKNKKNIKELLQQKYKIQNENILFKKELSYKLFYVLKFISKIQKYRDDILDQTKNYEQFHPLNFRNNILNILNILNNLNNSTNTRLTITNMKKYGIDNIFGISINNKIILLNKFLDCFGLNTDIQKCEKLDEINIFIKDNIEKKEEHIKYIQDIDIIAKGVYGEVEYIDFENSIIKSQKRNNSNNINTKIHHSISVMVIEYIIQYIISKNIEFIPKIYSMVINNTTTIYSMEKVLGDSFYNYFKKYRNDQIFLYATKEICKHLQYLQHNYKFVHGDFHVKNIFIHKDLKINVSIIDFATSSIKFSNNLITNFYRNNLYKDRIINRGNIKSIYAKSADLLYYISLCIYFYKHKYGYEIISTRLKDFLQESIFNEKNFFKLKNMVSKSQIFRDFISSKMHIKNTENIENIVNSEYFISHYTDWFIFSYLISTSQKCRNEIFNNENAIQIFENLYPENLIIILD